MASKRAVRRRSCGRKRQYADQAAVMAIAVLHRRRGDQGWPRAYSCRFCGGWHFGHPPAQVRRALRG